MSDNNDEKSLIIKKIIFLKKKLDKEIGYNYWKKYIASVFWSQISTPINLTITMLTAITTAQIQTSDLISQQISSQLAIVSLIITTLNTFFRPHTQYATNTEYLSKWNDLGVQFENEYYNRVEGKNIEDFRKKLQAFQIIQNEVNNLRKAEGTNTINFLTDIIFFSCFATCLRNNKNWLDGDKKVEESVKDKLQQNTNKSENKTGKIKDICDETKDELKEKQKEDV